MKIDWKRKLTSRKLWVALAGFVAGLIVAFGGDSEVAETVSGCILSGAAVIGYVIGEGLADGESIVITRDVEADKQGDVVYVLEFTTEDGQTQSFETLHYEVAPISLLSVDAAAGATPIAFTAPEK